MYLEGYTTQKQAELSNLVLYNLLVDCKIFFLSFVVIAAVLWEKK
jgi:hypothetical protein